MKTTRHHERKVTQSPCRATTSRHSTALRTAAAVLLVASAAGWSAVSSAQTNAATELPLVELEASFWACDHAATVSVVDGGTASTCSSLTEALKHRKFGGDFSVMLAWWRQHKSAEHQTLAEAGGAAIASLAPAAPK